MTATILLFNPTRLADDDLFGVFVGRDALADRLMDDIRDVAVGHTSRHWVVVAPRGYGKSHFVEVVARRLASEGVAVARLPEEHYQVSTLADLLEQCFVRLSGAPSPWGNEADPDRVVALATDALRTRPGPALVILENLSDLLSKLGVRDQRRLRELLMRDAPFVVLATALAPVGVRDADVFHDFFHPLRLDQLSADEVQQLVTRRLERDGDAEMLAHRDQVLGRAAALRTFSGGNPRLVLALYTVLREGVGDRLYDDLLQLLDRVTPYYQARLADVSPQEARVLTEMSVAEGPLTPAELGRRLRWKTNAVTAVLSRLGAASLVEPTGRPDRRSRYWEVVDRMFRIWIQMREDRSSRRTLKFLADFLQGWFEGQPDDAWAFARKLRDRYWAAAADGEDGTEAMTRTIEHLLGALGGDVGLAAVLDDPAAVPELAALQGLERKLARTTEVSEREALVLRIVEGWEMHGHVGRGQPALATLENPSLPRLQCWAWLFWMELGVGGARAFDETWFQQAHPTALLNGPNTWPMVMLRAFYDRDLDGTSTPNAVELARLFRDALGIPTGILPVVVGVAVAGALYSHRSLDAQPDWDSALGLVATHQLFGWVGAETVRRLVAGPHGRAVAQGVAARFPGWDGLRAHVRKHGYLVEYERLREAGFFVVDEEPFTTALEVRETSDRAAALAALHPEVREVVTLLLGTDPSRPHIPTVAELPGDGVVRPGASAGRESAGVRGRLGPQ